MSHNETKLTLKDKFIPACADDCPMEDLEKFQLGKAPCQDLPKPVVTVPSVAACETRCDFS